MCNNISIHELSLFLRNISFLCNRSAFYIRYIHSVHKGLHTTVHRLYMRGTLPHIVPVVLCTPTWYICTSTVPHLRFQNNTQINNAPNECLLLQYKEQMRNAFQRLKKRLRAFPFLQELTLREFLYLVIQRVVTWTHTFFIP